MMQQQSVPSAVALPSNQTIETNEKFENDVIKSAAGFTPIAKMHQPPMPTSSKPNKYPVPGQKFKRTRVKRTFKVIMVGDAGVGKTCLSFRFCNGRFPENTEATIGVDFRERNIDLEDEHVRVQLWDTAGQERFRQSMVAHYYRNVSAVVFVYDVSKRSSFINLPHWIDEFRRNHRRSPSPTPEHPRDIPCLLVGNKCDLPKDIQQVATDEATKFADQNDMPLFETSAKADSQADHVESIFMTLVHKLVVAGSTHVQSEQERQTLTLCNDQNAAEAPDDQGWCC